MDVEIAMRHDPYDVSAAKLSYDIESRDGNTAHLRLIEDKGRRAGADEAKLTFNELHRALNSPEQFILALVEVHQQSAREPR